ncbi:TRAP transporter large permease [Telmatospirillum sp. J64-1]|uniref:TRAP transporter large permease n=1 Tax=Telmatospirillum sp. J64-1 TaxID=2502183 RepID=UPI001C8F5038|nr:TRAP transporter large permease [Telmatospirillum sp. J64-1]
MISLAAVAAFLVLLLMGAPIAVCLGLSASLIIWLADFPLQVIAQRLVNAVDSVPLLAVPLFILAANIFNAVGLTDQIFKCTRLVVGRIRAGLAQVSILASLIFSGISGAALADIGGLGNVQMRLMTQQGYSPKFTSGITVAAATIGPLFPPSIPLIIFAATAEISAVKVLLAGVVPALLITLLLMIMVGLMARKYDLPRDTHRVPATEALSIAVSSIPAMLAPILLVGGLVSGYFGPTEVAAVTVAYGLLLGLLQRSLTWELLKNAARETVRATSMILFVVATAAVFAWILTVEQVPVKAGALLLGLSENPIVLLIIVNLLLLVVGMFLESIAAILILTPILMPALTQAGVDPIHLGVVMVLNLMIGLLTPPIGMSLYMMSAVSGVPVEKVLRGTLPFFLPLLLALLLVTVLPGLSLWLPNMLFN